MFIGGIAQIINAVKATPVEAMGIALGIARFLFSAFVGWASFSLLMVTGVALLDS